MSLTSSIGVDYISAMSLTFKEAVAYINRYNDINTIDDNDKKEKEYIDDVDTTFIGVGTL